MTLTLKHAVGCKLKQLKKWDSFMGFQDTTALTFFLAVVGMCCLVAKSCLTLRDLMGCSPPGSSVHGTSQAKLLEWVAISFSRGSSWPRDDWNRVSCIGRRILYHLSHRKACDLGYKVSNAVSVYLTALSCIPPEVLSHTLIFCFRDHCI